MIEKLLAEYVGVINNVETIAKEFTAFTKANPVVGGVVGMYILGVVTFFCKRIPMQLMDIFKKQFTVTLTVSNTQEIFHHIMKWYDKKGFGKQSRTMRATNGTWGYGKKVTVSAGFGNHYFWFKGRPFKLSRHKEDSNGSSVVKEQITFITIGRSQQIMRDLIKSAMPEEKRKEEIKIYKWGGGEWVFVQKQKIRSMDSVILSKDTKQSILEHIDLFIKDKKWRMENGIPYRTGLAFHGPPGTGKTSLVQALCGHYEKNLYKLSLSFISDEGLENAFSQLGDDAIVLIEDIDTFDATKGRKLSYEDQVEITKSKEDDEEVEDGEEPVAAKGLLTLSGILNAIDGVTSSEGRILIITSNAINKLDKALMRPGRVDNTYELGYLTPETYIAMLKRFFPDLLIPKNIKFKQNISPAALQGYILTYRHDPHKILPHVIECD